MARTKKSGVRPALERGETGENGEKGGRDKIKIIRSARVVRRMTGL